MKWTRASVVAFAFALALPGLARAAVITQNLGFDTSTPIINTNGANVAPLLFNTFDTNLGILDTVDIRITGNLNVNVTSPASPQGTPPSPYGFSLTSELAFGGFGFLINPAVIASGVNNGVITPHAFNYNYAFEATLDTMSDLLGVAFVSASSLLTSTGLTANEVNPPLMSLSRASLSSNVPGLPYLVLPQLTVSGFSGAPPGPSGTAVSTGNVVITYHYTPRALAMPEPGSLALLVLAATIGLRRGQRGKW